MRVKLLTILFASALLYSCTEEIEPAIIAEDFAKDLTSKPLNGQVIGKISATSNISDEIIYSLNSISNAGAFSVSANTGEIMVKDANLFDINATDEIVGEVTVRSGILEKDILVTINLRLPTLQENAIEYFKEIAMGFEFGNASEITRRWESDMKIFVGGNPSEDLLTELNQILGELNDLITTEIKVEVVSDSLESNHYLYFGSGEAYAKIYPGLSEYVKTNNGLFSVYFGSDNIIYRAHSYVNIVTNGLEYHKHILREEVTQSLGLGKDSYRYIDSIFQQSGGTLATQYSSIDKELIRLLYHPDMEIGLNYVSVENRLYEILKSEW